MSRLPTRNLERGRTEQRLLDIADNIAVAPTFERRGPPIPDITRPEENTDPFDYLTDEMVRIVLRSIGITGTREEAKRYEREGFFEFLLLPIDEVSLDPETLDSYLLYQAGLMKLDFTRAPYGSLPLGDGLRLIRNILQRRADIPFFNYLAVKFLYPDLDVDILTEDSIAELVTDPQATPVIFPVYRERKRRLLSVPRDILRLFFRLYNAREAAALRATIVAEPEPIEPYIFYLADRTEESANTVRDNLRIVVPPNRQTLEYVLDNIVSYNDVVGRLPTPDEVEDLRRGDPGNLSRFPDEDLFDILGIYVDYASRNDLINKLEAILTAGNFFFIPLLRRCANERTFYHTETSDLGTFLIAYGNYRNYRCFEVEEILANLRRGPTGAVLTIPGEDREIIRDREKLKSLLSLCEVYPDLEELANTLREFLTARQIGDPEIGEDFSRLTKAEKRSIKELLLLFFKTGMYMRGWTGTGCYPVTTGSTSTDVDPMPLSESGMLQIRDHYDNLSKDARNVVDMFILYTPLGPSEYSLMERYETVSSGESGNVAETCIRINSSKFILSAYHYLDLLFAYRVPGFSPEELESIA
jgi:hypothetical protein